MPVEEKTFSSEVKRFDSEIANIKKSHDKFETKVEKAIDDLRQDMRDGFAKVDARIDRLDARIDRLDARIDKIDGRIDRIDGRLWWLMGAIVISILMPVALKFLFP